MKDMFKRIVHSDSPINSMGNKYGNLKYLYSKFPKAKRICEPFCGTGVVSCNSKFDKILLNDINRDKISVLRLFKENSLDAIDGALNELIEEYGLHSEDGNFKDNYYSFRDHYNNGKIEESKCSAAYLLLCICCFNHMPRRSKSGKFNQTFGDRCYNKKIQSKLVGFASNVRGKDIEFSSHDISKFMKQNEFGDEDFIFFDPPYLINGAGFEFGWKYIDDKRLYKIMDDLSEAGIKWGMTNYLEYNSKENVYLKKFIDKYPNEELIYDNDNGPKACKEIYVWNY